MPLAAAVSPIPGHMVFLLLVQLALLLVVARLGAELCKQVGLPAVVGELASGIVLGPTVLGHFLPGAFTAIFPPDQGQFHLLDVCGTLGMVLLLLLTGLETDVRLLKNLGRAAFIASIMGMVVPFLTGFGLGVVMPESYLAQPDRRIVFCFFLATAMSISAMPVIAKILMDLDLTRRNIGVVILSAGVVDDTVGWVVLSAIAGVASHGQVRVGQLVLTLLMMAAFLAAVVLVLYPALRRLLAFVTRHFRSHDSDLVLLLVVTLLCGALTEWIGIHAVFGAFVAGALFRQLGELKTETVHRLESFVFAFLAPVFFGTVGLKVDLNSLHGSNMLWVVLAIACLGKLLGCTVGGLWGGMRFWEALSIAVAMNARGAMELVVATIGLSLGILNQQMFSIIVVVAVVTSFMAPLGLRLTMPKVRMTEDEQRRMLAEHSKGVFDPVQVRVLVPTAGGANASGAILLAAGLAKRSVHAIEVLSVKAPVSFSRRVMGLFRRSPQESKDRPSALHRTLADVGLPPSIREVSRGDVAAAIVEEARKGTDFIVLGASSHGRWLGGAVLEEVIKTTPCHVVIVKTRGQEQRYPRILVAFDGGVFSRVAVEFAARYAEVLEAELTIALLGGQKRQNDGSISETGGVVEAIDPAVSSATLSATNSGPVSVPEPDEESLRRISPVLPAIARRPKLLHLGTDVTSGALAHESASGKYDLVVLGAENRAVQNRLYFGADNERLIRSAPVTVALVVPHVGLLR